MEVKTPQIIRYMAEALKCHYPIVDKTYTLLDKTVFGVDVIVDGGHVTDWTQIVKQTRAILLAIPVEVESDRWLMTEFMIKSLSCDAIYLF